MKFLGRRNLSKLKTLIYLHVKALTAPSAFQWTDRHEIGKAMGIPRSTLADRLGPWERWRLVRRFDEATPYYTIANQGRAFLRRAPLHWPPDVLNQVQRQAVTSLRVVLWWVRSGHLCYLEPPFQTVKQILVRSTITREKLAQAGRVCNVELKNPETEGPEWLKLLGFEVTPEVERGLKYAGSGIPQTLWGVVPQSSPQSDSNVAVLDSKNQKEGLNDY